MEDFFSSCNKLFKHLVLKIKVMSVDFFHMDFFNAFFISRYLHTIVMLLQYDIEQTTICEQSNRTTNKKR